MNKMQNYKKYIMMGTLAGMFLLVCLLTTLTPYVTDDYKYFFIFYTDERVASLGDIVTSMVAHWYSWGGRVMAHTLVQLFLWLPKVIFNVANAAMYVWFVYLIYVFVQPKCKTISLSLLFAILAVLWLWTPTFGETILWLTGSCNYLWGCTLMLAWLSCFKRALDTPPHTHTLLKKS